MSKQKELREIIRNTDLPALENFFQKEDIHFDDDFALGCACNVGNCDVVEWLLNHGCSINDYFLQSICFHNYTKLAGVVINHDPSCGQKFLHYAIEFGGICFLQYLLDIGIDPKLNNYSFLMTAMKKDKDFVVNAIIKNTIRQKLLKNGRILSLVEYVKYDEEPDYDYFFELCVNNNEPNALLYMCEKYQLTDDLGIKLLGKCVENNNVICAWVILDNKPGISIPHKMLVRSRRNQKIYKLLHKYSPNKDESDND